MLSSFSTSGSTCSEVGVRVGTLTVGSMTAPGEKVGVGAMVGVGVGVAVTPGVGLGIGVGVDVEVGGTSDGDGSRAEMTGTGVADGWSPHPASSEVTIASITRIRNFKSIPGPQLRSPARSVWLVVPIIVKAPSRAAATHVLNLSAPIRPGAPRPGPLIWTCSVAYEDQRHPKDRAHSIF